MGLDVGTKQIGVALGDDAVRVAQPLKTVDADAPEALQAYIHDHEVTDIVVGRPRNQAGSTTNQTTLVEQFVAAELPSELPVHWQDESMTSVIAEERLAARGKPYQKQDIDAEAATIILQDFLETIA